MSTEPVSAPAVRAVGSIAGGPRAVQRILEFAKSAQGPFSLAKIDDLAGRQVDYIAQAPVRYSMRMDGKRGGA